MKIMHPLATFFCHFVIKKLIAINIKDYSEKQCVLRIIYSDDWFFVQIFIYNVVISTAYTLLDLPPDLQWLLEFIIENTFSLSSAMELLNQTDSHPNSNWGKISNAVNGRNRPLLRKKIYLKWVKNVSKIQDCVNKHFEAVTIHPKLYICSSE